MKTGSYPYCTWRLLLYSFQLLYIENVRHKFKIVAIKKVINKVTRIIFFVINKANIDNISGTIVTASETFQFLGDYPRFCVKS